MKETLKVCMSQWEHATSKPGVVRSVHVAESKINIGEFEIGIKMSATVTDMAQSEKVSLTRKFRTTGQATERTDADIQDFEACAKQVERDFEKKCSVTFTRLARMQNSDRFNERNPY